MVLSILIKKFDILISSYKNCRKFSIFFKATSEKMNYLTSLIVLCLLANSFGKFVFYYILNWKIFYYCNFFFFIHTKFENNTLKLKQRHGLINPMNFLKRKFSLINSTVVLSAEVQLLKAVSRIKFLFNEMESISAVVLL